MDEIRWAPRRRVFKDGVIQAKGLGTVCTVRDFSDKAAALLNGEAAETPQHLTLSFPKSSSENAGSFGAMATKWVLRSSDTATEFIVGTRPNGPPERERVQYLI